MTVQRVYPSAEVLEILRGAAVTALVELNIISAEEAATLSDGDPDIVFDTWFALFGAFRAINPETGVVIHMQPMAAIL